MCVWVYVVGLWIDIDGKFIDECIDVDGKFSCVCVGVCIYIDGKFIDGKFEEHC